MRNNLLFTILSILLICHQVSYAQISMPDTVCIDKPVSISTNIIADSYYWNFCSGNLQTMPQGEILDIASGIEKPAFIDFAFTDKGIYALVSNHEKGTISLLNFGNSIQNTPTVTDLGNFDSKIPDHTQGFQIVEHEDNWYAFVTGGQKENSRLTRLSFGSSLENIPTVNEFYFPNELDYPVDLQIIQETGNWFGFSVNFNNNSLVKYSFGNSPANTPTLSVIDDSNLNNPCGITMYEEEGKKYLFVSNYSDNSVSRFSFGNSYNNNSDISTFKSSNLQYPFDLTIIDDCEKTFGFILNRFGDVIRMDFTDIDVDPIFVTMGKTDYLFNPQGISDVYRIGDSLYAFVANIDNSSIARMLFPVCDYASPTFSVKKDNESVVFTKTGNANVRLEATDASNQKEEYCKNIEIVENPVTDMEDEIMLIPGETAELDAGSGYASYQWSTRETTQIIRTKDCQMYYVTVSNEFGCTAVDSIEVKFAGIPTVITPNNDGINDTWELRMVERFPDMQVQIFDRFGNEIASYKAAEYVWDCTDKKNEPVRADTYWYKIDLGDDSKTQTGNVTVLR